MATEEQQEEKSDTGFRVIDRRREGRAEQQNVPADSSQTPPQAESKAAPHKTSQEPPKTPPKMPPKTETGPSPFGGEDAFVQFLMSLATSAMMHLGLLPGPDGKVMEQNLPLARQTIDILGLLEAKTKGNLSPQEAQLLSNILSELRMHYVEEQHKP